MSLLLLLSWWQFPSGAPQVKAAVEEKAWDIGIAGSVPNVIAGQQGIHSIAISNDESYTTEVVGAPGVTEWPPQDLTDLVFAGTPKSTGELLLRKCLEKAGLDFNDDHILFAQQGEVMDRLVADGDPKYGCLWAPNTYTYREANPRAKVFCSGKHIDFPIYGGLMVREEYGEQKQEIVSKVLAAYLRGVTFMQNTKEIDEVLRISAAYHEYSGTPISENALEEDLILRPLFNLDQQLDHMSRNFANEYISEADKHYYALEDFLFEQGVIENKFEPKEYLTDKYMKLVSQDPELRAYSYYGTGVLAGKQSPFTLSSNKLETGSIVGIVLGVIGAVTLLISGYLICGKKTEPVVVNEAKPEQYQVA